MTLKICQLVREDRQGAYEPEKIANPPLVVVREEA